MTAVDDSGGGDALASGIVLRGPPLGRSESESNEMLLDGDEKFHKYQGEVFCNRALNMKRVMAVGFDMDYTLAQYIPETFELLAHRGAVDKLVNFMVCTDLVTDTGTHMDADTESFQTVWVLE